LPPKSELELIEEEYSIRPLMLLAPLLIVVIASACFVTIYFHLRFRHASDPQVDRALKLIYALFICVSFLPVLDECGTGNDFAENE
jgi:hypothetical protein